MALSDCLKKVQIEQDIADFMLDRSSELAESGMDQLTADRQVISEMFQDIEDTLVQIGTQLKIGRDGKPKKQAEFAGTLFDFPEEKKVEPKKEEPKQEEQKPEPIPFDGWRDTLFKARSYAKDLFTTEELDAMTKDGSLVWNDKDSIVRAIDKKLAREEQPKPEEPKESIVTGPGKELMTRHLIDTIKNYFVRGERIKDTPTLVRIATNIGFEAGVDYKSVKELYDIADLALNKYIIEQGERFSPVGKTADDARGIVVALDNLLDMLPTETQRSKEQVDLQQFSTPPSLAFLVNWTAGVNQNDNVLEPSAGEGNIAVFAHLAGANVTVNEYDENRISLLKQLPFGKVTQEDAKHIHAVNALKDTKISVVVMNPPFSRDVALGGKMDIHGAEKHIDAALAKLEDGGRLVAIVGRGMTFSPAHNEWFTKIQANYNLLANIGISGDAYSKKGTSFDNRILVIDKTGPTNKEDIIFDSMVKNYSDLVSILNQIPKNIRKFDKESKQDESTSGRSQGETTPITLSPGPGPANTPTTDVGGIQPGDSGRPTPEYVRPERNGTGDNSAQSLFGQGSSADVTPTKPGPAKPGDQGAIQGKHGERDQTGDDNGPSVRGDETKPGRISKQAGLNVTRAVKTKLSDKESIGYDQYSPEIVVEGSKEHPTKLVESSAMASVPLPQTDYNPHLSQQVVDNGALSTAQLEDIVLAGNAHKQILPNGNRRGFFLGAGTGYGKGRTIAGIILDNWNKGNKKAVWISVNNKSHRDSPTYWSDVGGDPAKLFIQKNPKDHIKVKDGVLLTTYGTFSNGFEPKRKSDEEDNFWKEKHQNRLQQLAQWLGKDFDGVIVFDESHKMANSKEMKVQRGRTRPSQSALAGIELQRILPNAKIVYSSATGATEISNFTYAQRLGLWGDGTSFGNSDEFIDAISKSGVSGMEIISKDLKAMGLYTAKTLSYDGVEYKTVQHKLLPQQIDLYNQVADAWQIVLQNVNKAIEDNNTSRLKKTQALSAFWGAHQRFFSQIITTIEMPTLVQDIQQQLDDGKSIVVQVVNTGAAQQERSLAEAKAESDGEIDYDELDLSPKMTLIDFLRNSYPVQQYEDSVDPEGNTIQIPVVDSEGNPVLNPESVKRRDALIEKLNRDIILPESPIDMLINTFGVDNVAEVTGRSRRIVLKLNKDNELAKQEEPRSDRHTAQDTHDFMEGKKRVLIFSKAGGTGASFHASLSSKNQEQRVHYVLQAGWQADAAIQGFGRSHRSNQRIPPIFKLVTTDLKAQMRFLSSIARRLEQLGALTKGQRDTGGQGVLDATYNLESRYAKQALFEFYQDVEHGKVPGVDMAVLEQQMALRIYKEKDGVREYNQDVVFNTNTFLNRIMSLKVDLMDKVFEGFIERMNEQIDSAQIAGTYDAGIEPVEAENIKVVNEQEIYTDKATGGKTYLTTFELTLKNEKRNWNTITHAAERYGEKFKGFFQEKNSGKVYAIIEQRIMDADGKAETKIKRMSIVADSHVDYWDFRQKYENVDPITAEATWDEEFKTYPDTRKKTETIVKGLMLPIWNKLPERINVRRYIDETGTPHLGRFFSPHDIQQITDQFKVENNLKYSSQQVRDIVSKGGKVRMSNGFELVRATYQSLPVIKILGANSYRDTDRLQRAGAMFVVKSSMTIQGDFFIPMDQAVEVIPEIEKLFNTSVVHAEDAEGGSVMADQKVEKPEETQPAPTQAQALKEIDDLFSGKSVTVTPKAIIIGPKEQPKQEEKGRVAEYLEQKHSKTGQILHTAKLRERVTREQYESYKYTARFMGGKYSSYKGEGMQPGFLFSSKENAQKFIDKLNAPPGRGMQFSVTDEEYLQSLEDTMDKVLALVELKGEDLLDDILGTERAEKRKEIEMRGRIELLAQQLNTPIIVVRTPSELPRHILDEIIKEGHDPRKVSIHGIYDTENDKVYLILSELPNFKEAVKTAFHEVIAHKGLPAVMGWKQYKKLLRDIYDWMEEEEVSRFERIYKTEDPDTIASEYIAYLSESGYEPNLLERIVSYIRQWIRKYMKLAYSGEEIKSLLKQSYENLKNQAKPQGKDFDTAQEYLDALTVWHGSPHNFDQFSAEKIGTGEGNQMFGYGLYFTDKKDIAEFYAASNSKLNDYMDKVRADLGEKEAKWIEKALARNKWRYEDTLAYLGVQRDRFSQDPKIQNRFTRIMEYIMDNPLPKNRYLYEILIGKGKTPGQMDWLDYGKPLRNTQIVKIADQVKAERIDSPVLDIALWDVTPGRKIYELLTKHFGSNKAASSFLSRAGIDGMTYPIGTFQGGERPGKNYVVFNDTNVTIQSKLQFSLTQPETPEEPPKQKGPPINILQNKWEKRQALWQNRMLSVREWQNKIRGLGGMITDISNPYRQENLSHGIVKNAIQQYDNDYLKPFEQAVSDIMVKTGMDYDQMNEYLMAKHAPERNKEIALQKMSKSYGIPYDELKRTFENNTMDEMMREAVENSINSGMETEKALDIIEMREDKMTPEMIDNLWNAVRNATRFSLDRWLRDGFIDIDTHDKIRDMYKFYVPLRNWKKSDADNLYDYQEEDIGRAVNPLKRAKGRTSLADDPMQYIVNMAHSAVVMGEKNRIKQHAARLILDNKEMKDMHRFKKLYAVWDGTEDPDTGKKNYVEVLERPAQELWDQGHVLMKYNLAHTRRRAGTQAAAHEVDVFINGEKFTMVLPADVGAALNKTPSKWDDLAFIMREAKIGQFTRWLSSNFTSKNPAFIVVNQIRDLQFATIAHYLKGDTKEALDFMKVLPKVRRAIIQHIAGKGDLKDKTYKMYRDFLIYGGETGYVHLKDVDQLAAEIKRDLARLTGKNSAMDKIFHSQILRNAGLWMEHMAIRSENLSRFATFMVAKQQGLSDREAAFRAKEITVNFNRKGSISSLLGSVYAFFNASMQGGETILRLGYEHKGKFAAIGAAGMAMGFMEALMNGLWGGDDDDGLSKYDSISDYVKYNNFVFMVPGIEKYLSVPLPHGFRWFHALGVISYQAAFKHQKTAGEAIKNGLSNMFSAISPVNPVEFLGKDGTVTLRPIVPTGAMPFYDILVNETYSGAKVHKTPFTQALNGRIADSNLGLDNVNMFAKGMTDFLFKLGGGNPDSGSKFYEDENGIVRPVREIFDLNPSNIEHTLEYYLGGRGMFWNDVLKTSLSIIGSANEYVNDPSFQTAFKDVNMNEVPVLKSLIRQPWKRSVYTRYYDIIEDIENYKSMVRMNNKAIDPDTEYPQEYSPEYEYKIDLLRELKGELKDLDEDIEGITDPEMVGEVKSVQERMVRNFCEEASKYDEQ